MTNPDHPLALITRPEPGATTLAQALQHKGYKTLLNPMLTASACRGKRPHPGVEPDAVLFTSGNAVRYLPDIDAFFAKPAFAVGTTTADLLRAQGFAHVIDCNGTAHDLKTHILRRFEQKLKSSASRPRLLLPTAPHAGRALARSLEAEGCDVLRWHVYKITTATALNTDTISALTRGELDSVFLLSTSAAKTFANLVRTTLDIEALQSVKAYCLSETIAAACINLPFGRVTVAERPTLQSLLAAL